MESEGSSELSSESEELTSPSSHRKQVKACLTMHKLKAHPRKRSRPTPKKHQELNSESTEMNTSSDVIGTTSDFSKVPLPVLQVCRNSLSVCGMALLTYH